MDNGSIHHLFSSSSQVKSQSQWEYYTYGSNRMLSSTLTIVWFAFPHHEVVVSFVVNECVELIELIIHERWCRGLVPGTCGGDLCNN